MENATTIVGCGRHRLFMYLNQFERQKQDIVATKCICSKPLACFGFVLMSKLKVTISSRILGQVIAASSVVTTGHKTNFSRFLMETIKT